jgi:hypothetical protein
MSEAQSLSIILSNKFDDWMLFITAYVWRWKSINLIRVKGVWYSMWKRKRIQDLLIRSKETITKQLQEQWDTANAILSNLNRMLSDLQKVRRPNRKITIGWETISELLVKFHSEMGIWFAATWWNSTIRMVETNWRKSGQRFTIHPFKWRSCGGIHLYCTRCRILDTNLITLINKLTRSRVHKTKEIE